MDQNRSNWSSSVRILCSFLFHNEDNYHHPNIQASTRSRKKKAIQGFSSYFIEETFLRFLGINRIVNISFQPFYIIKWRSGKDVFKVTYESRKSPSIFSFSTMSRHEPVYKAIRTNPIRPSVCSAGAVYNWLMGLKSMANTRVFMSQPIAITLK